MDKITKTELAAKLGISRPTLDKYLNEGFPSKITDPLICNSDEDKEYEKLLIENEMRLVKYSLKKLEDKLEELSK